MASWNIYGRLYVNTHALTHKWVQYNCKHHVPTIGSILLVFPAWLQTPPPNKHTDAMIVLQSQQSQHADRRSGLTVRKDGRVQWLCNHDSTVSSSKVKVYEYNGSFLTLYILQLCWNLCVFVAWLSSSHYWIEGSQHLPINVCISICYASEKNLNMIYISCHHKTRASVNFQEYLLWRGMQFLQFTPPLVLASLPSNLSGGGEELVIITLGCEVREVNWVSGRMQPQHVRPESYCLSKA